MGHRSSRALAFPISTDPHQKDIRYARDNRSFRLSRTLHPRRLSTPLSIGGAVPQRRVEVTDLVSVIEAVAGFGRDVQAANPAASFEVSTRVVAGRKPRGFDAADKVDAFGGRAFLPSMLTGPRFTAPSSIPPPASIAPEPGS